MTDKVQKILSEIATRKLCTMDEHMAFYNDKAKEDYRFLCEIEELIKALKEEPVSEDLEEAAFDYAEACKYKGGEKLLCIEHFKAGAKWKKENIWKPADGDDLPEIDREVIAIIDYDFGHYKVVYAHRPNPNGWNGTNRDTGEDEHFDPVIYDQGGWNQPHVLYWLDAKLPYEENKINKEIEL